MPATVRAVSFDLDDTLFDHGGAVRAALRNWLLQVPAADLAKITEPGPDRTGVHQPVQSVLAAK